MHLLTRWRTVLLAALLVTVGLVGLPQAASAAPNVCGPWHTQQDMADSEGAFCRSTWLVDPGVGNFLSRADLVRAHELYESQGFTMPWLWYAPRTTVTLPGPYGPDWTSCHPVTHVNGICPDRGALVIGPITGNFVGSSVVMDVFAYNDNFVSAVCGNYGVPLRPLNPPVPQITVHKFNDLNANRVQDPGEPPLAGWTFQLVRQSSLFGDQNPGLADTQTTDANGNLTFHLGANAGPGTYTVQEVPQNDWAPTTDPVQTVVVPDGIGDGTVANLVFGNRFQAITATGTSITPTEGTPFTGTVASFTDPDSAATAGEYTATVDWGGGTPAGPGAISKAADGTFTVAGTHTYAEEGAATVTVTVTDIDNPANTATATTPATIGDAGLTPGNPTTITPVEGTSLTTTVGTFTDTNPGGNTGDFTATVDWGDGHSSPATVAGPTGGPFTVTGTHTYADEGSYPLTISVADTGGATTTLTATAAVTDAALTAGSPTPINAIEGAGFTASVGAFTDGNPAATTADFTATIDWGDGHTSTGTVSGPTGGPFTITGTHTYADEGTYPLTVSVVDDGGATATLTDSATVADAALTATGNCNLLSTNPVTNLPVATFTDANPGGSLADFTATIDWGDGTPASAGTVTGPTGGPFTVTGSHTYATLGPKTITVHILDDGGASATAVSCLIVFAYPTGGNFVIGHATTANGAHVNFWGSQWAENNLVTGTPPDAFKGFEDNPLIPTCGGTWASRPGNSSNPPSTIPTYMAVIVSTHISQNGSTITGDVPHIVIVATDPGYAGDPGHEGTGTIVATLC